MNRVLRPKEQATLLGVSRCTLHRIEKSDSTFPQKIRIGKQSVGRMDAELLAWIESRRVA